MKLKRLNRVLQSWSQKQVGHVKTQLGLSREIFHRLEIAQDNRALTQEEDWLRCGQEILFGPIFLGKNCGPSAITD